MRLEDARMRMEFEFQQMLKSGAVYATGYASHSPFDMPATRIVADRWRLLEANFDDSTAKGPNLEISGILVFDGSQASPVPIVSSKAFSVASLREWYGRWVSSNRQNGHLPSRDEDLKAARQALGESIPRSAVRRLRQELAPETWKQPRFFALRKFALFISVDRDHLSKMTILSGHDVDAAERLTELAELLAAGLMRLQARKSSELSDQNGENSLHYDASQRGRANLVSPEVTA